MFYKNLNKLVAGQLINHCDQTLVPNANREAMYF